MGEPVRESEFYVGYLPKAPPGQAHHTVIVVLIHLMLSMVAATLIVSGMRDPGPGVWDTTTPRSFEGVLVKSPYPVLFTEDGQSLLVVDFGKRGSQQRFAGVEDGARLTVTGYLLERDERRMVELAPEETAIRPGGAGPPAPVPFPQPDVVTLVGEIVDSKCFLGAMKPGEGKTHKACAVRCISGGIPPMLVCWDGDGHATSFLLSTADGGPVGDWVLPLVGERVEVRGRISDLGGVRLLGTSAADVRRH